MDIDLAKLRKDLDEIDATLIGLLAERFQLTQQVGIYKAEHALPAIDPEREKAQFKRIEKLAKETGLKPQFAQKILRTIIDEVVENHRALRSKELPKINR